MPFDLMRRHRFMLEEETRRVRVIFSALRLIGILAATITLTLIAIALRARNLFISDTVKIAGSCRTVDGEIVASLDVVFRAEVYINDIMPCDHLARITSIDDAATLLAGRVGKAVKINFLAL